MVIQEVYGMYEAVVRAVAILRMSVNSLETRLAACIVTSLDVLFH
jgi:hypothetical protein